MRTALSAPGVAEVGTGESGPTRGFELYSGFVFGFSAPRAAGSARRHQPGGRRRRRNLSARSGGGEGGRGGVRGGRGQAAPGCVRGQSRRRRRLCTLREEAGAFHSPSPPRRGDAADE